MHVRGSLTVVAVLAGATLAGCGSPPPAAAHAAALPAAPASRGAVASDATASRTCSVPAAAGQQSAPGSQQAPRPAVGAEAFAGRGRLAFSSSGRLYVLDGSAAGRPATLHVVAAPAEAAAPAWSRDGRWLAFLVVPPSAYPVVSDLTGTLWLAGADGGAARPVLANAGPFSWSPASDVLAATVTDLASGRSWLCELAPGLPAHLVPGVTGPAIWSPDGRQLVFTTILSNPRRGFYGSMLGTIPASGGAPTVRRRSSQAALIVAGWWPDGQGLMAWTDEQGSASLAADGQNLVSFPLSGGRSATLGWTLLLPPFLATSPALRQVAVDNGGDRVLWDDKTIRLCAPAGGCAGLPGRMPGATNLDPALAPVGQALAFVHGSAVGPRSARGRRRSTRRRSRPGTRPAVCGCTPPEASRTRFPRRAPPSRTRPGPLAESSCCTSATTRCGSSTRSRAPRPVRSASSAGCSRAPGRTTAATSTGEINSPGTADRAGRDAHPGEIVVIVAGRKGSP
jgi:WD40-like Beta Propeller Repeat